MVLPVIIVCTDIEHEGVDPGKKATGNDIATPEVIDVAIAISLMQIIVPSAYLTAIPLPASTCSMIAPVGTPPDSDTLPTTGAALTLPNRL